jgi:hypothetical protein
MQYHPIYEFLRVLKNFKFSLKIHRLTPTVLEKIISLGQKLTESPYFFIVTPILWIGYP